MGDMEYEEIITAAREYIAAMTAEKAALEAENAALREALKEGVDLIRGDAVGAEWKKGCAGFLRKARAALARQTEGEG